MGKLDELKDELGKLDELKDELGIGQAFPFSGHTQTVQTQIRRRRTRRLIRVFTVCLQVCLLKLNQNEKSAPDFLVSKPVPLIMILWPCLVAMLERSKGCQNEIMRS